MNLNLVCQIGAIRFVSLSGLYLMLFSGHACADLSSVLKEVEQNAPAIMASRAQADASQAALKTAKSKYWGEVDLFANDIRYNDERLVRPISFPPNVATAPFDNDQYAYGVSFNFPLDINGGIRATIENAERLAGAADYGAEDQRLRLLFKGAELYRNLQRLTGQKAALDKQIEALNGHLKVADAAVKVGRMASVERLRIAADLESVRGQLAGVEGKMASSRAGIAALINQPSFNEPIETPITPPTVAADDYFAENRPDLLQAREQESASAAQVKQLRSKRLPTLGVKAAAQHVEGYDATGDNLWSITTRIQVPLWDGGGRRASISKAEAARRAAQSSYLAKKLQARSELEAALANWKAAEKRHRSATAGVSLATETSRIQSDRFSNGRISATDLVDAEAALAKARAAESSALADWWGADDALRLATGKAPRAYNEASGEN